MAFDAGLAERVRETLEDATGVTEKRMFGGIVFLRNGNMFVGVVESSLMVRVGPVVYPKALAMPGAREMDFTGKPMTGYVFVDDEGTRQDKDLAAWVERGLAFVKTLPKK